MSTNRTWVDVQKKTFTGWANNFLKERILKINDIETDLDSGVLLINLLELISGQTLPRYTKNPKTRFQKIENNNFAIRFIQNEGLKLVGIGAEDIVDGKLKLILGLIWTLILRYQIQSIEGEDDGNSPKAALLEWVRKRVQPYGVPVNDFDKSWQDGRALTALTDSLRQGVLPMNTLTGNRVNDVNRAMDTAQDNFNIPKIMDPQDMVEFPDELSVMTYVSYFRDYAIEEERKAEEFQKVRADPSKCTAEGPGLQGGFHSEAQVFTITARNYFGEVLTKGGEHFVVVVAAEDGSEIPDVQVTDQNNGTYQALYVTDKPGSYTVYVKLNGADIKDTPVSLKIEGASAAESSAFGPGLQSGHTNRPAVFTIQARDASGNDLARGGDPFAVGVTNMATGESAHVEVLDNGDGTYTASYHPTTCGAHQVDVLLRDLPIADSPFSVVVYAGTPENSYAEGPGLEGGQATYPAHFTIHSVDVDGKPVTAGGDPFSVVITGPAGDAHADVVDNGNGTYTVNYNPSKPGEYTVAVSLFDKPIKDTPRTVHIKPASNSDQTEVLGIKDGQALKPQDLKIIARDSDGNQRSDGGDNFKVRVDGPSETNPKLVDNGDGTYDVTFTPTEPGDYDIHVLLDEKDLPGFPKRVHIKPAPSATNSYAEGPGLTPGQVVDNEPAQFTIHAVDPRGNPRTDGGDPFHVSISGPEGDVNASVVDNGDGTYGVTYEPSAPGSYKVNITLEGSHIKDSPHHVDVKEGTDAGNSGFGKFTFTVVSRDKRGNPKTFGGDAFEVSITGPAEHIELDAIDNGDGSYTAAYTLVGNGRFVTDVRLNGKRIEGAPFKQNVGSTKTPKDIPTFTKSARAN